MSESKIINLPSKESPQLTAKYLDVVYKSQILSVSATKAHGDKLKEIRSAYNKQHDEICSLGGIELQSQQRDKLFTKILMASLSKETDNPIIPSIALDLSDLDQKARCFPSVNFNALRQLLTSRLVTAAAELQSREFSDENITFWYQLPNNTAESGRFVAVNAKTNVEEFASQKCSTYVYESALKRWNRNILEIDRTVDQRLTFERVMYLLLMRYQILYGYTVLNNLATHPATFRQMLDDQGMSPGVGCEMYGSVVNAHMDVYGSLFYDLERHFGSLGSAAFIRPISGLFTVDLVPSPSVFEELRKDWFLDANNAEAMPPLYIYIKMQGGWGTENDVLRKKNDEFFMRSFEAMQKHNIPLHTLDHHLTQYIYLKRKFYADGEEEDFVDTALQTLRSSPYFRQHCFLPRARCPWVNYIAMTCSSNFDAAVYMLSNNEHAKPFQLPSVFEPLEAFTDTRTQSATNNDTQPESYTRRKLLYKIEQYFTNLNQP